MKSIKIEPRVIAAFAFVATSLAAGSAFGLTGAYLWGNHYGNASLSEAYDVAVDGDGSVVMVGMFDGLLDFGGGDRLSTGGGGDIFVAKYSTSGAHLWSMRRGGTGFDRAWSVAVDTLDNLYVTGGFTGSADFGGGYLASAGGQDVFLAKYSSNGAHQWSKRFGGATFDAGLALAVDGAGNVILTGAFSQTIDFGGGVLNSGGGYDVFLAALDGGGNHLWSRRLGGGSDEQGLAVAVDGMDEIVVTGYFNGTADFGGGNLSSASVDIFLAKYTNGGVHLWSKRFGGAGGEAGTGLDTNADNHVFLTGYFNPSIDFGGGTLQSAGQGDLFLARFDDAGNHVWSQRRGGVGHDVGYDLAVTASGDVLLAGDLAQTVVINNTVYVDSHILLARYDPDGAERWSRWMGGPSNDAGRGVATDGDENAFVAGYFTDFTDLGGGSFQGEGGTDVFLAKYARHAQEPVITAIEDVPADQGRHVQIDFTGSGHDQPASGTPAVRYEAYRRIDAASAALPAAGTGARTLLDQGWIEVGSIDATGAAGYSIDAGTLADSTIAEGPFVSTFFVRTATATPTTFFDSPADSGYSLDNLSPPAPDNLVLLGGQLTWDASSAADFDYFTVYGSNTNSFGSATLVDYSVSPSMDVSASPYVFYFVAATDFSGNEGEAAALNTLSDAGGTPRSYVLSVSNFPNPFNPRTTVRYTVPARGRVTIGVYDARGTRVATLVDRDHAAGAYTIEWNGRADTGTAVSSGVYFARIEHGGTTRSKKMVLLK